MDSSVDEITDSLLARYATGDATAASQLLQRYRPFLRRIIELRLDRKLRGRVDPSDVVQETQLELMRRIPTYVKSRPVSFRVWLHQMTCQQLTNIWRRHRRAQRRSVDREVAIPENSAVLLAQTLLADSPSGRMQQQELVQKVRDAVNQLSAVNREIVLLRTFDELTNAESAERLGIDPAAASKRYGRALLHLRQLLHPRSQA